VTFQHSYSLSVISGYLQPNETDTGSFIKAPKFKSTECLSTSCDVLTQHPVRRLLTVTFIFNLLSIRLAVTKINIPILMDWEISYFSKQSLFRSSSGRVFRQIVLNKVG